MKQRFTKLPPDVDDTRDNGEHAYSTSSSLISPTLPVSPLLTKVTTGDSALEVSDDYLFFNIFDDENEKENKVLIPQKKITSVSKTSSENEEKYADLSAFERKNFSFIRRISDKFSLFSPVEVVAWTILLLGLLVLVGGINSYFNNQKNSNKYELVDNINIPDVKPPTTNYSTPIFSQAIASVPQTGQEHKTYFLKEVYPKHWTEFVQELQEKNHQVFAANELHPRLHTLQLAIGTELNLLLTPTENYIEEMQLRVNLLTANKPFSRYHQIISDLQGIVAKGAIIGDEEYLQKLSLPQNPYEISLPYSSEYNESQITAQVSIKDPLYLIFRIKPATVTFDGLAKIAK